MKLQLSYPVDTPLVSQNFGDNPQMYSDPKYGNIAGHNGIDFIAQHGYPVYATHDGLASFQIDNSGGHGVVIVTDKEYDYEGGQAFFKTIYWHLADGLKEPKFASPFQGKTGFTKVSNGDLIGYADNTGASTGDHLHFGLKPVAKGEDFGTWYNVAQNNGFNGAINPALYFDGTTQIQLHNLLKQLSLMKLIVEKLKQLMGMR